ncbi:MAG TPA: hypothetical protein VLK34_09930 [Nocardioidaceae bacterium]|nr:hypothetical protein [Nocardioidaceae bacterium]
MTTHLEHRPADPDRVPAAAPDDDALRRRSTRSTRAKRIPQDPQPVPQQRSQTATAAVKYPPGYFFG